MNPVPWGLFQAPTFSGRKSGPIPGILRRIRKTEEGKQSKAANPFSGKATGMSGPALPDTISPENEKESAPLGDLSATGSDRSRISVHGTPGVAVSYSLNRVMSCLIQD